MFEYAQSSNFWQGMLGIAITLLEIYNITTERLYFDKAKELLISSSILSNKDKKLQYELMYVINNITHKTNIN